MKIQDLLSETPTLGVGQQIKTNLGFNAGASTKGVLGTMALKALGLNNTANAFGSNKGAIGGTTDFTKTPPAQLAQQLSLKPGATVDLGSGQKGQVKSIDQTGVKFADGTIWGGEKLATMLQQQQALQTLSQQKAQ